MLSEKLVEAFKGEDTHLSLSLSLLKKKPHTHNTRASSPCSHTYSFSLLEGLQQGVQVRQAINEGK